MWGIKKSSVLSKKNKYIVKMWINRIKMIFEELKKSRVLSKKNKYIVKVLKINYVYDINNIINIVNRWNNNVNNLITNSIFNE